MEKLNQGFNKKEQEREEELREKRKEEEAQMRKKQDKWLFELDNRQQWSGFFTKNGQSRVGVDAFLLSGDSDSFTAAKVFNLNISH